MRINLGVKTWMYNSCKNSIEFENYINLLFYLQRDIKMIIILLLKLAQNENMLCGFYACDVV